MRTRYRNVCAFLPSERFSVMYFADATGYLVSQEAKDQRMVEQKPSRPAIILFLSTFPLFSPAALLRGRSSLSRPVRRPRRDEQPRRCAISSVVYSRVFFVSSTSFLRNAAVARGRTYVWTDREAWTSITAIFLKRWMERLLEISLSPSRLIHRSAVITIRNGLFNLILSQFLPASRGRNVSINYEFSSSRRRDKFDSRARL